MLNGKCIIETVIVAFFFSEHARQELDDDLFLAVKKTSPGTSMYTFGKIICNDIFQFP